MSSIRINRVYTRSGDTGETGLVGGDRISKGELRIESVGDVDELNAQLGVLKEALGQELGELQPLIGYIQQELFDIGAELACNPKSIPSQITRIESEQVKHLEQCCDYYNEGLPELKSFIIPGGSLIAAQLHLSRAVCRRAERRVVCLEQTSGCENPEILKYLNRLSDLLFILCRWSLAKENTNPGLWVQRESRIKPKL